MTFSILPLHFPINCMSFQSNNLYLFKSHQLLYIYIVFVISEKSAKYLSNLMRVYKEILLRKEFFTFTSLLSFANYPKL